MGDDLLARLQPLKDADVAANVFVCLYRMYFEPIRRQAYKDDILAVDLLNRLLRYEDSGDACSGCELALASISGRRRLSGFLISMRTCISRVTGSNISASPNPLERNEILSLVPDLGVMYHREQPVRDRGVVEFIGKKRDIDQPAISSHLIFRMSPCLPVSLFQVSPYEIDQVFGEFDRRSRSLFRREQVKPYVVFEDFGHQTVDAAANVRQLSTNPFDTSDQLLFFIFKM